MLKLVCVVSVLLSLYVNAGIGLIRNKVVVCYVGTWAAYRPERGLFDLNNVDPKLCTHLVYAFAGLDESTSTIKSLDAWQDLKDNYGKGGYERATGMKSKYPHLIVTLAIGGWNQGSDNYSKMSADPQKRKAFVSSIVPFLKKYNFDGLDLDWEYPAKRGGSVDDKQNFVSLTKELKEALSPHKMILTSAIGASKETIDAAYDIPQLSKYLDLLHIMCYDLHGAWDMKTGANAALHSHVAGDNLSVEFTMNYLLSLGAPADKLVVGVPFYGRTFIKSPPVNPNEHVGVPTKMTGFMGPFTKENGFMGYNEICLILSNSTSGWSKHWDQTSQTPYLVNEDKVIMYDDPKSIVEKVRFAMNLKFRGLMIWSIDTDDFHGDCTLDTDNVYGGFVDGLRKLRENVAFHKALPIVEQKIVKYLDMSASSDVYQLSASSAYVVQDGEINLVLPPRILTSYPLLRTLNDALIMANHEMFIKQEMEKAYKELEKDNEVNETNNLKYNHSNVICASSIIYLVISLNVFKNIY